ncbi:hypothetical protein EIN_284150 [Entamoeba invadens IP1]|uniref:Uncharacterized protein n=1 Tax=Entamoeba invadens IP1 TaxID=370355 RepID=L7FKN6_ENTIV|nr:hypothetical protein EIN_284150 [Entamoeba invadens IP1]ELP84859.1 hypothetical protein EIN_284150 [Entamoeba invadens IP1]|eukprot:XP_004184205.1 hypothetical protein EIN_284150 [Entamoeba invadens IP1]
MAQEPQEIKMEGDHQSLTSHFLPTETTIPPPPVQHFDMQDQTMTSMMTPTSSLIHTIDAPQTILPECPEIEDPQSQIVPMGQVGAKAKKCVKKELVKDKDGNMFYCYTYLVKNKSGEEHEQHVYVKRTSKSKKVKTAGERVVGGRVVVDEKERKVTKQHQLLAEFVDAHISQIQTYNKFIVSRVLQDVKREQPDSKVSYGLVKKVLEQKGLLQTKKSFYKL